MKDRKLNMTDLLEIYLHYTKDSRSSSKTRAPIDGSLPNYKMSARNNRTKVVWLGATNTNSVRNQHLLILMTRLIMEKKIMPVNHLQGQQTTLT